jgi:hypothetical protein
MPETVLRIAEDLLRQYGHLSTFEVDPVDREMASRLLQAFERLGCSVEAHPFKTLLVVTPPQGSSAGGGSDG